MGFISSGNTDGLVAYLTQKGRELLINGDQSNITVKYFSLGDSDTNYHNIFKLTSGTVPDLTGDNSDCVMSLASNVGIKYSLPYSPSVQSTGVTIPPAEQDKPEIRFKRTDDGTYQNVLDVMVNLDNIGRYILYHSSSNTSNSDRLKVIINLESPIQDIFDEVRIVSGSTTTPTEEQFLVDDDIVYEMLFDPNVYKMLNNTYIDTTTGGTVVKNTSPIESPIVLTFSSSSSGNTGAGRASVGIYGREIGYLYKPYTSINNESSYSFYTASLVENVKDYTFFVDQNNTILNKYTDFMLGAKIVGKDEYNNTHSYLFTGNKNLDNINDVKLNTLPTDVKFANQYCKLFLPFDTTNNGTEGIVTKEIKKLKDFVETSGLFNKIQGTNEYRTSKLTFNVYPKNTTDVKSATLNIVFKFDIDELLIGDISFENISDEGEKEFISYDFKPTNNVFRNKTKSFVYYKNDCGVGFQGSEYIHTVTAGMFTGATQAEADTLAYNFSLVEGQAIANSGGTCTAITQYGNDVVAGYYYNNYCSSGYYPEPYYVYIEADTYTSYISKTDANIQAATAAQQETDQNGSCIYSG